VCTQQQAHFSDFSVCTQQQALFPRIPCAHSNKPFFRLFRVHTATSSFSDFSVCTQQQALFPSFPCVHNNKPLFPSFPCAQSKVSAEHRVVCD
jgi:hypothetical protein